MASVSLYPVEVAPRSCGLSNVDANTVVAGRRYALCYLRFERGILTTMEPNSSPTPKAPPAPQQHPLRLLARVASTGVKEFFAVNGLFLSAGLSFYVLIYCFPLLLLFTSALGYALSSQRAMEAVEGLLRQLLPTSGLLTTSTLEALVNQRELLGGVGAVSFLLFGTFLFDAARYVLNVVFKVTQQRPLWKALGADVMVMLAMGALLGLTIVVTFLLEITRDYGARVAWIAPLMESGWVLVGRAVGFALTGAILYLLYRVAPAKTLSHRTLVASAFAGACLFEISKWLFGIYVDQAKDFTGFYGALSGLIFFVLWLYYASTMFTLAASLGHAYEKERGLG